MPEDNFKPEDFIEIGREITDSLKYNRHLNPSKIYYGYLRTAASRIYFGTFLLIRERMKELGERIPRGHEAHEKVAQLIMKYIDKDTYDEFIRFRRFRNQAEYDLPETFKIKISMVIYWITVSERIINKVMSKLNNQV